MITRVAALSTVRSRVALGLACGLACGSATRPPIEPGLSTTRSPEAPPAPKPSPAEEAPPQVPLEPELLALLEGAHRPPPTPAPEPVDERSPCHPERPNSPQEQSLCICEEACARPFDRQALARRLIARTGDHEAVARWLEGRGPMTLHYPYTDTDGLLIAIGSDGKVTHCTHSSNLRPGSKVSLECASIDHRHDAAPAP